MKILKTKKYAAFEGDVYTPQNEDKWVSRNKGRQNSRKKSPTIDRGHARFRPSVLDFIPTDIVPQVRQHERERDRAFQSTLKEENQRKRKEMEREQQIQKDIQEMRGYKYNIEKWLGTLLKNKYTNRLKRDFVDLYSFKNKDITTQELQLAYLFYRASLGDKQAEKDLLKRVRAEGDSKEIYPKYLDKKHFYRPYKKKYYK